jgi:hypothetical protein
MPRMGVAPTLVLLREVVWRFGQGLKKGRLSEAYISG